MAGVCDGMTLELDLSKCKTKEDVKRVFDEKEEELSLSKKALQDLQRKIRDGD